MTREITDARFVWDSCSDAKIPVIQENKEYFVHLWTVFKRYNIVPSKAIRLEYDFVIHMTESKLYLQKVLA